MLRRTVRERKEYLFRKQAEAKDKQVYERKRKIRDALEQGKAIPTELRNEEASLRKKIEFDDEGHSEPKDSVDDEYARAGIEDPRVLLTTSRDPSSRLQQFVKEMRLVFPNSQRINRGSYVIHELVAAARTNGFTDLVIVHEHRGEPDGLIVSHMPYGPTAFFALANCVMRHDIDTKGEKVSEAYPHLIFHKFESKLGLRVKEVLRNLFPVPKEDAKRVMTFANASELSDFISFRHHVYAKDKNGVVLREIGPRFEMRPYMIKLGTLDMNEAQTEWALRPYMNTASKRKLL